MKEGKNIDLHPDEDGEPFKAEKFAFRVTADRTVAGMDESAKRDWIAQETQAVDDSLAYARKQYSETNPEVIKLRAQRRVLYELATGL